MSETRTPRSIDDWAAALESVSKVYARRFDIERDAAWRLGKMSEELGELTAAYLKTAGQGRVRGETPEELHAALEDEAADLFAHLLIFARWRGVDLDAALSRKWLVHLPDDQAS